ncbi:hypothetical protein INS49_002314 [Diaporthe citri]|uniref:uncharacterized protein n=1 Tax=Diaporthe citri TaxID=83186 RepID=UPI001C811C82|nr:uncharacterized protein INS49_002314 [Diaporthe citri]KAG6368113.1 hypothetical protein INS49_002314 [Diaporthe citri]
MDRKDRSAKPRARLEESVRQLRSRLQLVRPSRSRINQDDDGPAAGSVKAYQPGKYPTIAEAREKSTHAASYSSSKLQVTEAGPSKRSEQEDELSDFEDLDTILSRDQTEPASVQRDDVEWQPSLVIGSSSIDAGNPSAKEVARRNMLQWEHIYQHHQKQTPGTLQLGVLDERRKDAAREYEDICARADPEDDVPRNETRAFKEERVTSRLAVLQETLAQSTEPECEPMRANISAAIHGYEEGTIGCSSTYTLIFAGHIVDTTCRTWAEFTVDRKERLDGYFEQHGPGHLWWEPPLAGWKDRVNAKKALILDVTKHIEPDVQFRDDQCHFRIPMCFRKETALTCRVGRTQSRDSKIGHGNPSKPSTRKRKWVWADDGESDAEVLKRARGDTYWSHVFPEKTARGAALSKIGPVATDAGLSTTTGQAHFFEMLLDSGCETPILYHADFVSLGFTNVDMNAATVATIHLANGRKSNLKIFELLGGVQLSEDDFCDHDLFPTCVIKLEARLKPPAGYSGERLSGVLPFLAYYMSFAPGMDKAHLGTERGDVLGMQRIPGGLRYDPFMKPQLGEPRETLLKKLQARNPSKIVFEHQRASGGRTLMEEEVDSEGGTSRITLIHTDGTVVQTCKIETPRDRRRQKLIEFVE